MTTDHSPDQGEEQLQPAQSARSRDPSVESELTPSDRRQGGLRGLLGLRGTGPRREGEVVRLVIVLLLFAVLIITVVWAFLSANGPHWNNVKSLLDLLFPAETALLGTAIAFYMSTQASSSAQQTQTSQRSRPVIYASHLDADRP